jgi:CRISPR-associated protein Cas4
MEFSIPISLLNDFIFCPRSVYFHGLFGNADTDLYHDTPQKEGKLAHTTIDGQTYSTRKTIISSISVYSEKYGIYGKIDLYNRQTFTLTERKREIKAIYDGYIFQLYAQYFGMIEMNYEVKELKLYDISHNKTYPVDLPTENKKMLEKFENLIRFIRAFTIEQHSFEPNPNKCQRCIYNSLCDLSLC